jgi:hypothetical protein
MHPSNFSLDVTANEGLQELLALTFDDNDRATHFQKTPGAFLVYSAPHEGATELPVPMAPSQIAPIVAAWLREGADYGSRPDMDGSVEDDAFRVTAGRATDSYDWSLLFRVEPRWSEYHK